MEKNIFVIGILVVLFLFLGFIIKPERVSLVFVLTIGIVAFFITFINLKLGLFALIFIIPLTTQFSLGMVGRGSIDIATDDIMVLGVIIGWLGYLALTKEPLFKRSPLNMPFLGFFLVSLISLLPLSFRFSENVLLMCFLHILKWFEYIIIYFIVITTIKNKEELRFYTLAFMSSCIFVAIAQVSKVIQNYLTGENSRPLFAVPFGFESNGISAAYYVFFLSIILAMVLKTFKGTARFFWICVSLLVSFTLFTNFCRAAYLGIIVACFILGFILDRRFAAIIMVIAILMPIVILPPVERRIAITVTRAGERIQLDASAQERVINWEIALREIKKQPILGIGFWGGRYSNLFGFSTSHSQYLTVILETGMLGFIFFLLIFFRIFKTAIFNYRESNDMFIKSLNMGYIAGLVGILVQSMFGETFDSIKMTGPLWFMTAIIVLSNQFLKKELEKSGEGQKL